MKFLLLLVAWGVLPAAIFSGGWLTGRLILSGPDKVRPHLTRLDSDPGSGNSRLPLTPRKPQLQEALRLPDHLELQSATARAVLEMNAAEAEASIDDLLRMPPTPDVLRTLAHLWRRFGEFDGVRAMERASAITNTARRRSAENSVLRGLTWMDPEAGWQAGLERDSLLPVAEVLQETGRLDLLFSKFTALPEGDLKNRLSTSLAVQLSRYEPGAMLPLLDALPAGDSRNRLLAGFGGQWASVDPAAAARWAETLDKRESIPVIQSIANPWALAAPKEASTWLSTLPTDPALDQTRMSISRMVVLADPEGAMNLADQITDPMQQLAARQISIQAVAAQNPASAARMAETLTEAAQRVPTFTSLLSTWQAQDPQAAMNYVLTSPNLTHEERSTYIAHLQKGPSPEPQR